MANILTTLFPAFAFLGIILFACDKQDKRKIELEKVKAKAEWDRASECFRDDVTQERFEEIVEAAGRSVKRLESLSVNGHKVYGTVASLSGISSWKFVIDFDYKGHLTSDYTVASSNDGSGIAERVADRSPRGLGLGRRRIALCARLSAPIAVSRRPVKQRSALPAGLSCCTCRKGRSWVCPGYLTSGRAGVSEEALPFGGASRILGFLPLGPFLLRAFR
ncbi:hypothetical protein [Bifidobacterium bifidum]|uniref:hypothetical protein n=1 Tax=Bifidobacterium bifidum TaxID=1681 RepID=UPI00216AC727|nr:hypothetical protein [Bifidobacterium bifidum]